jgi:hypothetical protein
MAKTPKARLDQAGLTGLGLEKLVEILLDEASFNKPLKSRLLAALAGGAGADEVARLIDKKLETLGKSRGYLSPTRANTFSVELRGLLKNITAELAELDRYAAFERVLRFLVVGAVIEERARKGGARLARLLEDARDDLVESALKLDGEAQLKSIDLLEKARIGDEDGNLKPALQRILCGLQKPAADAWKAVLLAKLKGPTDKAARWRNAEPLAYLQQLASHADDIDAYIELEALKPEERRDGPFIARMLHKAGRHAEALEWVRKPAAAVRVAQWDDAGVGEPVLPPRLLEAEILDAMKLKAEAQTIRWQEFERTLRPDILKAYIVKLDDFAEFEETDKAFALVAASPKIHEALDFLVKWPRLDLASDHVLRHVGKWDSRQSTVLVAAADALLDDYPIAATVIYRFLLANILRRGATEDYGDAATYLAVLVDLKDRLGPDFHYQSHDRYVKEIKEQYGRRPAFWNMIPWEWR